MAALVESIVNPHVRNQPGADGGKDLFPHLDVDPGLCHQRIQRGAIDRRAVCFVVLASLAGDLSLPLFLGDALALSLGGLLLGQSLALCGGLLGGQPRPMLVPTQRPAPDDARCCGARQQPRR